MVNQHKGYYKHFKQYPVVFFSPLSDETFYLSISGITKSSVPIIATISPNLLPLAI